MVDLFLSPATEGQIKERRNNEEEEVVKLFISLAVDLFLSPSN